MKIDQYNRRIFTEEEICNILYRKCNTDLSLYNLQDPDKHNAAININYSDLTEISKAVNIDISPEQWHQQNQNNWHMPQEYQDFDVAEWVLKQCKNDAELQRAGHELIEYSKKDLLIMLCYLKYLVDTMQENNIVWGVGRGSSVASFVLYLLKVHRINSLYYDLDFNEFMR
jgi:DNA polymerase III alpha subunit